MEFEGLRLNVARSDPISNRLDYGEILAVVGPSGSGKSQLLSYLAGLRTPIAGSIRYYGQTFSNSRTRRQLVSSLGIAFQHSGLIHSLTVFDNVVLPYRCRQALGGERLSDETIKEQARLRLALVGVADKANKYPHEIVDGEVAAWRWHGHWPTAPGLSCLRNRHWECLRRSEHEFWSSFPRS